MNRVIKFRAWDKKAKMLTKIESIDFINNLCGACPFGLNLSGMVKNIPLNNIILMQFTGLLDKNGKEIYFEDIIRFKFEDTEDHESYAGTAVITETINGGAGILYDWADSEDKVFAVDEGGIIEDIWEDTDLWDIEVIGNIYQDGHLLNKNNLC